MNKRGLFARLALAFLLASAHAFAGENVVNNEKVTVFSPEAMRQWKPSFRSLDDWITRISRKEWLLLYKKETKQDYVALFLDKNERLVVAAWRRDGLDAGSWLTDVTGEDKQYHYDQKENGWLYLDVEISVVPAVDSQGGVSTEHGTLQYGMGMICGIKKGYKGKLHIVNRDHVKKEPPRLILDYTLQWPVPK